MNKSFFGRGIASAIINFSLALLLTIMTLQFLNRPGWIIYDWLQRTTALPNTEHIALVLVDQHTIDQMANADKITFPFPRQLYGLINTVGEKVGIKGILYDILFTEPSIYGVEDDQLFAQLIRDSKVPTFMPAASEKTFVKEPVAPLLSAVQGLGGVHFRVEVDGIIRQAPTSLPGTNGLIPSLPEVAFRYLSGKVGSDAGDLSKQNLLRFYRTDGIPFISFYDLVLAYRAQQNGEPLPANIQNLKDRVIIVGYSAPGLHDLKSIPTDHEAPGLLVPATALANRFSGAGITGVSTTVYILVSVAFLFAVLLIGTLAKTPKLSALLAGAVFPGLTLLLTFGLWKFDLWFNPFPLGFGAFIAGGGQLLVKFYAYWADRRKFAKSLEYSMSPTMVKLIKDGELEVERYGEQREISILFCDLVGFTQISEKLEPRQLVRLLNLYSDAAVDLICKNGGYVDKFIGDAVMAFWGAPVPQPDHARLALNVALAYDQTMKTFNAKVAAEFPDFPELSVRVGVHTGPAIVGNIGARRRHNYTAIGDSVNLASRLEGLAKVYHCNSLISEDTIVAADAQKRADVLEIDQVIVQGRSRSTRIFTFVEEEQRGVAESYRRALGFYYRGQWQEALDSFEQALTLPASTVMAERCRKSLSNGIPKEWHQGAWNHEHK